MLNFFWFQMTTFLVIAEVARVGGFVLFPCTCTVYFKQDFTKYFFLLICSLTQLNIHICNIKTEFFKHLWWSLISASQDELDPLSYFSFQPVLHDWCNKGCGMCYPVCGMVHIKEPLLLIGKSSLCGGSGFPLSLSEWSLTICLTPYNRR